VASSRNSDFGFSSAFVHSYSKVEESVSISKWKC
jgi:hypothetical protein